MRYIHSTLIDNEQIIFMTRPHWIVFTPSVLILILAIFLYSYGPSLAIFNLSISSFTLYEIASIFVALVGLIGFIKAYIFHRTSEYGITNKRILMKMGWIERNSLEIFLEKIEAVHIDQTIPGRLLGYGSVIIIGTGGSKDPFINVPKPLHFRKIIQQEIDYALEHYSRRR